MVLAHALKEAFLNDGPQFSHLQHGRFYFSRRQSWLLSVSLGQALRSGVQESDTVMLSGRLSCDLDLGASYHGSLVHPS